jgi:hypothetical protein
LENTTGHVSTVVALTDEALIALQFLPERLLAADEEEEHGGRVSSLAAFPLVDSLGG